VRRHRAVLLGVVFGVCTTWLLSDPVPRGAIPGPFRLSSLVGGALVGILVTRLLRLLERQGPEEERSRRSRRRRR